MVAQLLLVKAKDIIVLGRCFVRKIKDQDKVTLTMDLESVESASNLCAVVWKLRRSFEMLLISALNPSRALGENTR